MPRLRFCVDYEGPDDWAISRAECEPGERPGGSWKKFPWEE